MFHSLEDSISHYDGDERTFFIIGGGEIYRHALELGCVNEMYITHVDAVYGADTFFPEFNESEWTMHELFHFEKEISRLFRKTPVSRLRSVAGTLVEGNARALPTPHACKAR